MVADKSIAQTLGKSAQKIFSKSSQIDSIKEPDIQEREIIEYESRMRSSGMEKFNDACYVSVVELYDSQEQLEAKDAIGAVVLYVKEDAAERLFRSMDYRDFDETNEESMMEVCGELGLSIVKQFVTDVRSKGYSNLITGSARKFMNKVDDGVDFNYDERTYFQIGFEIFKENIVYLDVTLGPA